MKKAMSILLVMAFVLSCGLALAEDTACAHNWSDWTLVKEASCIAEGTQRRICSECGTFEDKAISAADHNWGGWTTVKEVSCAGDGLQRRMCSDCGAHEDKAIAAYSHTWSDWMLVKDATCTAKGTLRRICTACGTHEDEAIPANGHTEASANNAVAATCTTAGKKADTICTVCNVTVAEGAVIEALGHTIVKDAAVEPECIATGLTAGEHCTVCDYEIAQEIVPAKGHVIVEDAAVEPECIATGLTAGEHCTVCDYEIAQEIVPAKGHTIVEDAAVEPECIATGLTAGEHCSVCDYEIAQQIVPAKGHAIVEDAAVEPTCTETGLTAGEHCSVCGEILVPQAEVPATGHDYKKTTRKPTTTNRGYDTFTCKVCGDQYRDNYKAKLPAEPEQTEATAPAVEVIDEFGAIVFDANGVNVQYTTTWATEDANTILTIIASADENGLFALRELHLSFELIEQLKAKNATEINYVVGDAEMVIPMGMFDDEMLLAVKNDQEAAVGYVLTVDPAATNDAGASGCFVKLEMATETERFDVLGVAAGMILRIADAELSVAESAVYVPADAKNTAE